jgi:GT2 family glycosyltransferase
MTGGSLKVDVVVLTWNDAEQLERCLDSVASSRGVRTRAYVVDNGSDVSAAPMALAGRGGTVMIHNTKNRGVAAGRNQGAGLGDSEYVCFLDSDAVLGPDALAHLARQLENRPDAAMSAPVFEDQLPEESAGVAPSFKDKATRLIRNSATYRRVAGMGRGPAWEVDFSIGACQLLRRRCFEAVGGFDERYFYGPEDVDLCMRLRRRGWKVVQVAAAACQHRARRSHRRLATRAGAIHAKNVALHIWRNRRSDHHPPLSRAA